MAEHVGALLGDLGIDRHDLPGLALRYVPAAPPMSTVIDGMRSVRNVEPNVAVRHPHPRPRPLTSSTPCPGHPQGAARSVIADCRRGGHRGGTYLTSRQERTRAGPRDHPAWLNNHARRLTLAVLERLVRAHGDNAAGGRGDAVTSCRRCLDRRPRARRRSTSVLPATTCARLHMHCRSVGCYGGFGRTRHDAYDDVVISKQAMSPKWLPVGPAA